MDTGDVLLLAAVILIPAILLWGLFLSRNRPKSPAAQLGIPQAMRPGQPDEVLEGPRLERIMVTGVVFTIISAAFIAVYWLPETQRQENFEEILSEESVHRGELIFGDPPEVEEDTPAAEYKELGEAVALGMGCIQCHGPDGTGGQAAGGYIDPQTGDEVDYVAPPLNNVFTRWDDEIVRFTIERGRPGTPMAAWGVEYGGPMTDQMVDDVMAWMRTLEGNQTGPPEISESCQEPALGSEDFLDCGQEIFEARCAVCHGPDGEGKDTDTYYPGLALWEGKVEHLSDGQHMTTVINGRRFAFMPAFAESPAQGIPVPPYPLTEEQIRAVVQYERSL